MDLDGRSALLTGATGGLGRAIAEALAERGAILLLSSRKADELEAMAARLPGEGHRALPVDLAEPGEAERLAVDAGPVDVLVANAGLQGGGRLDAASQEHIERVIRVNLHAPIALARALVPGMRERGSGHVVLISSLAGKAVPPGSSLYSATKFGLRGFGLGLRQDLHGTGVGVSVVLPGFVRNAGMFAASGAKVPPGAGTSTPEQVGAGVVRAVARDKAEVMIAPPQMRAATELGHAFPGLARLFQRKTGAAKTAEQIARAHTEER